MVERLRKIVENAILTHAEPSKKSPDDHTTGVYTLFSAVRTEAGILPVKLTVKEYYTEGRDLPKTIAQYLGTGIKPEIYANVYDGKVLLLEDIEKEDASSSAPSTAMTAATKHPSASPTISVKDLLDLVKGDAARYIPKPTETAWTARYSADDIDDTERLAYNDAKESKRARAEFQRLFSGVVEADDWIVLRLGETAAIRNALKTGYGQIRADGKRGRVNTASGCYVFDITLEHGVVITDVIDHNVLNIHDRAKERRYSNDGRRSVRNGRDIEGPGRGRGELLDYHAGSPAANGGKADVSMAGGESGGDGIGNLRQGQRVTQGNQTGARYSVAEDDGPQSAAAWTERYIISGALEEAYRRSLANYDAAAGRLTKANLQSLYEAAIAQARASGDSNLANALYQELLRVLGLSSDDEHS